MTGAEQADCATNAQGEGESESNNPLSHSEIDAEGAADFPYEEDAPEDHASPGARWLLPVLAWVAVAGFLGGMIWLSLPALQAGLPPVELVQLIAALCVPPALVGILYLLALRTSSAEARRWSGTARAMRAEAANLDRVLGTLARKIDDNRKALAVQSTQLLAVGEGAAERLHAIANGVGEEARRVESSAQMLSDCAVGAVKNVNVVLSSLPKANDQLVALSERVEMTGLAASERAAGLEAQYSALIERGREADTVAGGAAQRLAAHLQRMEATSETAGARLEEVTGTMSTAVDALLGRTAEAVEEARRSIAAQGEAMLAMLNTNQATLDRAGRDSAEALAERIAGIEDTISRISTLLGDEQGRSDALFKELSAGVAKVEGELAAMHATGMDRSHALTESIDTLGGSVNTVTDAMRTGDAAAREIIATAEELLTALDATTREMDETLPEALNRLDARILESRRIIFDTKPELLKLVSAAEGTHDAVEAIGHVISAQRETLSTTSTRLLETLDAGREKAASLDGIVQQAIGTTEGFAEDAAPRLVEALVRVRETAAAAADQARETLSSVVPDAQRALEEAGTSAVRRAIDASVRRELEALVRSSEAAVEAANAASERLAQQMVTIVETTAAVENRIDAAREERESADSDSLARRVTLLVDALNSAAIDVTKTFSQEVSDSAWAAYLKGDRGVFTRRAVRLLDASDARAIHALYDSDDAFRESVNRYIHDFEAMLRHLLGLRDGSSLGVTMLSSDMGKLYVALAQAIERLRT